MAEKKTEKKPDKKVEKKAEKKVEKPAKLKAKAPKRERKVSAMRKDHLKVIEFLAQDLPKRPSFKMSDIAKAKFKDGPNITAERVARNSVRKPRQLGLVEIAERGEYRLTPQGAAMAKNIKSYEAAPDIQREAKAPAKKAAKGKPEKAKAAAKAPQKAAKKEAKPAAKKAAKPAKAEKPAKAKAKTAPVIDDPDMPSDPEDAAAEEPAAPLPSDEDEPAVNA